MINCKENKKYTSLKNIYRKVESLILPESIQILQGWLQSHC